MPSHFIDCVTVLVVAAAGAVAGQGVSTLIARLPSGKQPSRSSEAQEIRRRCCLPWRALPRWGCGSGPARSCPRSATWPHRCDARFIDARHRRLPDVLTLPSYPASIMLLGIAAPFVPSGPRLLLHALLGACVSRTFYLALSVISPAGMGWGDVKLSGVLGLYLGWPARRRSSPGCSAGLCSPPPRASPSSSRARRQQGANSRSARACWPPPSWRSWPARSQGSSRTAGTPRVPASFGAGGFPGPHGGQERAVVRIAAPAGVGPFEPGVIQQPVDACQPQPVGRLAEQPGGDATAAVPLGDMQVPTSAHPAVLASRSPASNISTSM